MTLCLRVCVCVCVCVLAVRGAQVLSPPVAARGRAAVPDLEPYPAPPLLEGEKMFASIGNVTWVTAFGSRIPAGFVATNFRIQMQVCVCTCLYVCVCVCV